MAKIIILAAALIVTAWTAWNAMMTPRVVATTSIKHDPMQMMANAEDLPTEHFVDYTLVFVGP